MITGPSGSGKSSLALDVLYTEGKRRYMESLSSYARQFLGIVRKPQFDQIKGLCPAIAIEQKTVGSNPRSTVGTITEIYDYLRILFARIGLIHCPQCYQPISAESPDSITQMILDRFHGNHITIAAPIVRGKKGEFTTELEQLFAKGFYRFMIDGSPYKFASLDEVRQLRLKKTQTHVIDILIDVIRVNPTERSRIAEAIEKSFTYADGVCRVTSGDMTFLYSSSCMCVSCATSIPDIEPRLFSFNSPLGACPECQGIGTTSTWPWESDSKDVWKESYAFFEDRYAKKSPCKVCNGKRLNKLALAITVGNKDIFELCEMSIADLVAFFEQLTLHERDMQIAGTLIREITNRLTFLSNVGLDYLTLNRTARTLSGGEGQRIRLATQIGSALSGVLYILDEPSIGLHQRDNDKLIETLKSLRDQGNTVVVVEHDLDTIREADYVVDMGPAAGTLGGSVTACGTPEQLMHQKQSLTGAYLKGTRGIKIPRVLRKSKGVLTLEHTRKNNLKDLTVEFPLGVLCGVSGVSGSGKSTLILDQLVPAVEHVLSRSKKPQANGVVLKGAEKLENMVVIDQTPIGRTPRSNPATYLGIFDDIRKLFASLPESVIRGYTVGRFSFNVSEGRCSECKGDGTITIEMHFLPEVVMTCKSCKRKRYNKETLQIEYKKHTIADVLNLTALEALELFKHHKNIAKRLQLMCEVGLDYIALGQPSTTLSGGEAQRIKLVNELSKRGSDTLYILDEPTTGLHNNDIEKLLAVLNRLVDKGNSMIVIEHNLDVLKTVDYLIDLGLEGGARGGQVVAYGTPRKVAQSHKSYTGYYLAKVFAQE